MHYNLVDAMKDGMRRLASGVSVISTRNSAGERFAMTASSVTSVSDQPPSLLVCINHSAHICSELVQGAPFAVNILGQQHQDVSIQCAGAAKGAARFAIGDWVDDQEVPVLKDAEAAFICRVDELVSYGTHNVVIGLIERVQVVGSPVDPLIYLNGAYQQIKK